MDAIDIKSSHGAEIHIGDGGVGAGVKASRTIGTSNQQVIIRAKKVGPAGNSKTCSIAVSGNNTPFSISVTEDSVSIVSATDGSAAATTTVAALVYALYQNATFVENFEATYGVGNGTGVLVAAASASLSGGSFGPEVFNGLNGIHNGPNGPGFEPQIQEATHHGTEDTIRRLSRVNKTAVTFDIYFDPDNAEHALLLTNARAGTKTNFHQYLNDGTGDGFAYAAYIAMSPSAPVDGFNVYSVTLNIDGEVSDI